MSAVRPDWVKDLLAGRLHLAMLESRLVVELHLRTEGALLPGKGVEPGTPLKMALKVRLPGVGEEVPVLLATSLKGALRGLSERIAKSSHDAFADLEAEEKALRWHHEPEGGPIRHAPEEGVFEEKDLRRLLDVLGISSLGPEEALRLAIALGMTPEDARELSDKVLKSGTLGSLNLANERARVLVSDLVERALAVFCPICRLYGSPSLAAKLRLVDALPVSSTCTAMRIHVGIDRRSLTSAENILYQEEVVEPGAVFRAYLIADNVKPGTPEAKLLASTLEFIRRLGLQVGGSKSRGLGLLRVDEEASRAWFCDFTEARGSLALEMLLDPRKGHKMKLEELVEFLRTGRS